MQMFGKLEIWAQEHARVLFRVLVLGVVALALMLRTLHLTDVSSRSPDEMTYSHFAQRIAAGGPGAYQQVFSEYAADARQWIYPSPTRIVPVLLFASVMKVTGSATPQAGAAVSWALGIGSVLLLAWLGRRYVDPLVGLVAALFLATYAVELEFARRAWGESTAAFLTLALMGAAYALESQPERRRRDAVFFALGTVCLLVKETCILSYVLCGVWLVSRRIWARDYLTAARWTAGGLLSILVAFGALTALSGSASLAFQSLSHVFGNGLGSNDWGAQNAGGPWYQFGYLLAQVAPFMALSALLGVAACFVPPVSARAFRGLGPSAFMATSLALVLTVGFAAASAFGPNLQYLRIMAPANPGYCLLAAIGVRAFLVQSEDWLQGRAYPVALGLLPVVFAVAAVRDYSLYTDVVVRTGMQDLAARWVLDGIEHRDRIELESARQALVPSEPAPVNRAASAADPGSETASELLGRSLERCRNQDWAACVSLAQATLRRDPRIAEAWNNAAVGYAGLRLWDDAARCASQAIKLRPDFQLAKNNLAWVSDEQAKLAR